MSLNSYNVNNKAFHFINHSCEQVSAMCEPIFEKYSLNQFSYMNLYEDGKIFRLVSHKEWSEKFLNLKFYNDKELFCDQLSNMKESEVRYISLLGEPKGLHQQELYKSGIWNILIRYKKEKNFIESWAFGTHPDNIDIVNSYFNEFNTLCLFVSSFKEKAKNLLNKKDKEILLQTSNFFIKSKKYFPLEESFLNQTEIKRFWMDGAGKAFYLTEKEMKIVSYLGAGKSLKEIATVLKISLRTTEGYIDKIKNKLNCYSKSEIIDKITQVI